MKQDTFIRNYKAKNFIKSLKKATPAPKQISQEQFPVGTIHAGRRKVAEGVWVHEKTGHSYGSHDGTDQHDIKESNHFRKLKNDTLNKIKGSMSLSELNSTEGHLDNYLESKIKHKNSKKALEHEEKDSGKHKERVEHSKRLEEESNLHKHKLKLHLKELKGKKDGGQAEDKKNNIEAEGSKEKSR